MPDNAPTMSGIRFYGGRFRDNFHPIYSFLRHRFYFEEDIRPGLMEPIFRFPNDKPELYAGYPSLCLSRLEYGRSDVFPMIGGLFSGENIIRFARYVEEDWNGFILLPIENVQENMALSDEIWSGNITHESLNLHEVIQFHNFDGCFWEIYTNIPEVLEQLIDAHRNSSELDLRKVWYHTDFPDPGKYREDYPPRIIAK